ncbi:MAG: hypothetical protein ACFCUX_08505 [Candidatus Methylacidiphilales bacterium]
MAQSVLLFSKQALHHIRPLLVVAILGIAALAWNFFKSDPVKDFNREVKQMVATVNRGEHGKTERWLSEGFKEMLTEYGMTLPHILSWVSKMDREGGHQYLHIDTPVFQPKEYAEAYFERSESGGHFSGTRRFFVPFIWQEGAWKVAGDFRSRREWESPFD